MIKIEKSIEQGFGSGGLYDILAQLKNGMLPISGETYFVSGKGNNVDGLSWETAFATIAAAISASNTHIALTENIGRRNRIYIDGGGGVNNRWEEALTVLPNHCDMIGVGGIGSWGMPVILYDSMEITTIVHGCHIYNLCFYNGDSSVPIFKMTKTANGFEFHNCTFRNAGTGGTIGIEFTVSILGFKINNCKIIGNPCVITGIQLDSSGTFGEITNNYISAITTGISIADAVNTQDYQLLIKDNVICRSDSNSNDQLTTGIAILDTVGSSRAMIIHNWISAVDAIAYTNDSQYVGERDQWQCIDNHIVQAATGGIEDSGS